MPAILAGIFSVVILFTDRLVPAAAALLRITVVIVV